jgi:Leucine-rich repeat (LRR) protein
MMIASISISGVFTILTHFCFFFGWWSVSGAALQCNISESELTALEGLYNSCHGSNWHWDLNLPPSSLWLFPTNVSIPCSDNWQGVSCTVMGFNDSVACSIVGLDLVNYGLAGPLPPSLNGLFNLTILNISSNRINSTIPQSLALMSSLHTISLSDNSLTGPLPSFNELINLQFFGADLNNITGSIPISLCNSFLLQRFSVEGNNVSGSLPECLYELHNLVLLNIRDNRITGSISASVGSLPLAEIIDLGMNDIGGSLPTQLGMLSTLTYLAVDDNRIASTIPTELGNLEFLTTLQLSTNFFNGSLPTELGRLSSLTNFGAYLNQLTGSIPMEFGNLSSLVLVNFGFNKLHGHLHFQLELLDQLLSLNVTNNRLSGPIPVELGNLTSLQHLDLSGNELSGSLPATLCDLDGLTVLSANNNTIAGTLPSCIGDASALQYVQLQDNALYGDIPTSIRFLNSLVYLDLSSNFFVGPIPTYIGELSSLVVLRIQGSSLSGTIPTEISNLKNLTALNLSFSRLNGTIPTCLANLSNLQFLNLSYAEFSGSLPNEIVMLSNLSSLYVNNNQLEMMLPVGLNEGTASRLQYVALGSNRLNGTVSVKLVSLPQLRILDLYNNEFTGPLPFTEELKCDYLNYYDLGKNLFTGTLPNNWTNYRALQYFLVNNNRLHGSLPSLILHQSTVVSLSQFAVESNGFIGAIPEGLYSHTAVTELTLGDNVFTGTLSSSITRLQQLVNLDLSSNNLYGNLRNAFVDTLPSLQLLNLANNSFTGHIPDSLISPNLTVLDLSSNCFSGTLSSHVCSAKSLSSLLLNSLSSESGCRAKIPNGLKFALKGKFPLKKMDGTIPGCYFNLSYLTKLQLGGNKLHGMIPDVPIAANLSNLDLSFNTLTGSIPNYIQTSGQFNYLSLQSNRLSGVLRPDFAVSSTSSGGNTTELYLSVNRLSGNIPGTLYAVKENLNILAGNYFNCGYSNRLPVADPNYKNFKCGSSQFSIAMLAWLCCVSVGVFVLSVGFIFLVRYRLHEEDLKCTPYFEQDGQIGEAASEKSLEMRMSSRDLGFSVSLIENITKALRSRALEAPPTPEQPPRNEPLRPSLLVAAAFSSFQDWLHYDFAHNEMLSSTHKFFVGLRQVWRGFAVWSLMYLGLLFAFLILKLVYEDSYRTVTIQELWVTTALFLHGPVPVIFLLLVLSAGIIMIFSSIDAAQLRSVAALHSQQREEHRANQRYRTLMESIFRGGFVDYFFYPVLAHVVNVQFAVTVNAFYVSWLSAVPTDYTFLFQAALSIIKTLWINLYIPFIMKRLYYLSVTTRFQTQITMLIVIYLLSPLVATLGASKNCFYYVFFEAPSIQSVFTSTVTYCYAFVTISINEIEPPVAGQMSQLPVPPNIDYSTNMNCMLVLSGDSNDESTIPPFIYNYNCSFSLLADYIPVLLYSYLISALVVPFCRLLLLCCSQSFVRDRLGSRLYNLFIHDTIHDYQGRIDEQQGVIRVSFTDSFNSPLSRANTIASDSSDISKKNITRLFDGSAVVARRTVDVIIMMTFGMACPLLAFTITLSVYVQSVVWRLLIGKYLTEVGKGSTLAFGRLERSFGDGLPQGTIGGLRVAIIVIAGFWAFIFYDMIGDVSNTDTGVGVAIGTLVFLPLLAFLVFKFKGRLTANRAREEELRTHLANNGNVSPVELTSQIRAQISNSDFSSNNASL